MSQVSTAKDFTSVWSRKPTHGPRVAETRWKEMRWPLGRKKIWLHARKRLREEAAIQMGKEWERNARNTWKSGTWEIRSCVFIHVFRKEWGKSGETTKRYFHSPLVLWLETASGWLPPSFLSPLFSQQTKSCIRLLLGFLYFVRPVKDCYFLLKQGLMFFVSPVPSQMESLTPRMSELCQYDPFKSNTLSGWNIASFHIYIRYLFPHEWLLTHLKPYYLNFANSGEGPIKTICVIFSSTNWSWKSQWRKSAFYLSENYLEDHDKSDKHGVFKEQWDIG